MVNQKVEDTGDAKIINYYGEDGTRAIKFTKTGFVEVFDDGRRLGSLDYETVADFIQQNDIHAEDK